MNITLKIFPDHNMGSTFSNTVDKSKNRFGGLTWMTWLMDGWTSRPLPVSSFGSLKQRRSSDQRRARRRHCDAFKRFFFFSLLRLAQTKRAIHRAGIYCADKRPSSHARTHEQSYLRISNVGREKKNTWKDKMAFGQHFQRQWHLHLTSVCVH